MVERKMVEQKLWKMVELMIAAILTHKVNAISAKSKHGMQIAKTASETHKAYLFYSTFTCALRITQNF